ncbi:ElyC/SanA/YdcF family protein [Thalassotalea sp. Y01]|uniref:ElyC/SanA/YdcF family protein n=1 Tax=Thalassotalea sp. Y01 TaxID=2729613 RepID=UPI00145DEF4F|nr:ElyC/SanA/YdcF family protein [Thalassotalea sp. Y01]NMP17433.1 DUF218 domain-containing protein [Thalassotalea sp. Y01]
MDWFLLKKLIGQLLQPMILILFLMLLALLLFHSRRHVARVSLFLATLFLFGFSFIGVSNSLIAPYEQRYPTFSQQQQRLDYIVILGCGHTSDDTLGASQQLQICSLQRMVEGMRVANLHPEATIITSGAAFYDSTSNAQKVKQALIELGFSGDIITNDQAKDTEDEAMLLMPRLTNTHFALVTNANHMPRAMTYFEQQGLTPIAAPTGYFVKQGPLNWQDYFPDANQLHKTETFFYEFFGQIWQWLKS